MSYIPHNGDKKVIKRSDENPDNTMEKGMYYLYLRAKVIYFVCDIITTFKIRYIRRNKMIPCQLYHRSGKQHHMLH